MSVYMYKYMYGIIVGCSALLIVICLLGKLSMGKSRKFTYHFSVYHDD